MKKRLSFALAASLGLFAAMPSVSQATPILGAQTFAATDGHVVAKFLGSSAGYTNDLYLFSPVNGIGVIFNNHSTPVGTTLDLGYFSAGTELVFGIHVLNTGDTFYTGSGILNPDHIAHAVVDTAYAPNETYVGFEDLFGGGDRDYDDVMFSFTNVSDTRNVPAPAPLALMGAGLVGLYASRRKAAKN